MKKYGRTYHLPISPGATSDDKIMSSTNVLTGTEIVVTEKMDGENSTVHRGGTDARSPDSRNHPSRDWLKGFAAGICHHLAEDERIVGENLLARHSIAYQALPSYFLGFAWIVEDVVQGWDDTMARFRALGITPVHELYRGRFEPGLFERLANALDTDQQEGFVARVTQAFPKGDMPTHMGKYVRKGHVTSDVHWMNAPLVPNGLAA